MELRGSNWWGWRIVLRHWVNPQKRQIGKIKLGRNQGISLEKDEEEEDDDDDDDDEQWIDRNLLQVYI